MCLDPIQSQLHELIEQFRTANRRQQRKLVTRILSLAQQCDEFWQGTSIDAEPYAEAYQAMMTLLLRKLSQFDPSNPSELTFIQWLNRLLVVETLERSSKIWRGGGNTDPAIYEEAKQIATKELLDKFDRYDPKKGSVINWFNFILKKRRLDVIDDWNGSGNVPIDPDYGEAHFTNQPDPVVDKVDFESSNLTYDAFLMRKFINRIRQWAEDKHSELRQCALRNRREVNCFTLILRRLPQLVERQGEFEFSNVPTWEMIAKEFDVRESTVRCHFTKHCIYHLKQAFPPESFA